MLDVPCALVLQPRGGGRQLAMPAYRSLSYGRAEQQISSLSAEITLGRCSSSDRRALADANAFEVELAVLDGDGGQAWVGPLTSPDYGTDDVRLAASDLFQWFERRDLPVLRHFERADLGVIFETLAVDALSSDTSPALEVDRVEVGVRGDRTYDPAVPQRAADVLRELGRTAVDWTTVGRRVVTGGPAAIDPLPTLTGDHLLSPRIKPQGLDLGNDWIVVGGRDSASGEQVIGRAQVQHPAAGRLVQIANEPNILDTQSAVAAAENRLLDEAPGVLTARLSDRAPVTFAQLVPGALVPVRAQVGLRTVDATFRLTSVRVSVNVGDTGATSSVDVTLLPV